MVGRYIRWNLGWGGEQHVPYSVIARQGQLAPYIISSLLSSPAFCFQSCYHPDRKIKPNLSLLWLLPVHCSEWRNSAASTAGRATRTNVPGGPERCLPRPHQSRPRPRRIDLAAPWHRTQLEQHLSKKRLSKLAIFKERWAGEELSGRCLGKSGSVHVARNLRLGAGRAPFCTLALS